MEGFGGHDEGEHGGPKHEAGDQGEEDELGLDDAVLGGPAEVAGGQGFEDGEDVVAEEVEAEDGHEGEERDTQCDDGDL